MQMITSLQGQGGSVFAIHHLPENLNHHLFLAKLGNTVIIYLLYLNLPLLVSWQTIGFKTNELLLSGALPEWGYRQPLPLSAKVQKL
jgi:hypothetical protein